MSQSIIPAHGEDFDNALGTFLKGKKKVSPKMQTFLQILVFLFTSCAVMMAASYAMQLGESLLFKGVIIATAIGIELAVVFFSAVIYPNWFLKLNQILAGILLPILSVFTIMSFMVSQQFAQDHKVEEMAKTYTEELQDSARSLSITESGNRASLQITRDRIEGMLDKLSGVEGSKATAVYHYLSHLLGVNVETIVLFIRGLWSLCFVTLCIALDAFVDLRLYSKKQLNGFINDWHEEQELFTKAQITSIQKNNERKAELQKVREGNNSIFKHGSNSNDDRSSSFFHLKPSFDNDEVHEADGLSQTKRFRRSKGKGERLSDDLYLRIRTKLLLGEINPSVISLKKEAGGSDKAYEAIDRLQKEGILYQGDNGRYRLVMN
jgi:hypothetical protein